MRPLLLLVHVTDEEAEAQRGEIRAFLAVGIAGAKALGQEFAWCVQGTVRRLAWLEGSEGSGRRWEMGSRDRRIWEGIMAVACTWRRLEKQPLEHIEQG